MTLLQENFLPFSEPHRAQPFPPHAPGRLREMGLPARYEAYRVENAEEIVRMIRSLGLQGRA